MRELLPVDNKVRLLTFVTIITTGPFGFLETDQPL